MQPNSLARDCIIFDVPNAKAYLNHLRTARRLIAASRIPYLLHQSLELHQLRQLGAMAKRGTRRFAATFGSGDFGRLAHGSNSPELVPRIVASLAGKHVKQSAAGGAHTAIVTGKANRRFAAAVAGTEVS